MLILFHLGFLCVYFAHWRKDHLILPYTWQVFYSPCCECPTSNSTTKHVAQKNIILSTPKVILSYEKNKEHVFAKHLFLIFIPPKILIPPYVENQTFFPCQPPCQSFLSFPKSFACCFNPSHSHWTSLSLPPPGKRRLVINSCRCWLGKRALFHGEICEPFGEQKDQHFNGLKCKRPLF